MSDSQKRALDRSPTISLDQKLSKLHTKARSLPAHGNTTQRIVTAIREENLWQANQHAYDIMQDTSGNETQAVDSLKDLGYERIEGYDAVMHKGEIHLLRHLSQKENALINHATGIELARFRNTLSDRNDLNGTRFISNGKELFIGEAYLYVYQSGQLEAIGELYAPIRALAVYNNETVLIYFHNEVCYFDLSTDEIYGAEICVEPGLSLVDITSISEWRSLSIIETYGSHDVKRDWFAGKNWGIHAFHGQERSLLPAFATSTPLCSIAGEDDTAYFVGVPLEMDATQKNECSELLRYTLADKSPLSILNLRNPKPHRVGLLDSERLYIANEEFVYVLPTRV